MLLLIIGDDSGNVATAPATTTVKLKAFSLFHWGNKQVSRQAASQPGVDYLLEKLKKYLYIYERNQLRWICTLMPAATTTAIVFVLLLLLLALQFTLKKYEFHTSQLQ